MVVSAISVTVAVAESVAVAETISMAKTISMAESISEIVVHVGDGWWHSVSVVAVANRRRCITWSVSHFCDSRCGIRDFGNGRCNDFGDSRSNGDLKIISVITSFYLDTS